MKAAAEQWSSRDPRDTARAGAYRAQGREIEVCLPLALGRSRAEIAERLGVSEKMAINHCRNIYAKLGVQSRAELVEKLNAG